MSHTAISKPSAVVAKTILAISTFIVAATFLTAPSAHADGCNDNAVKRGGPGGDYYVCTGNSWTHIVPTFDPNSADGYGPNQLLPPLCVRFPSQYQCAQ